MEQSDIIKNEKQIYYNQVRGVIEEMNDGEEFCNIVLLVGHENKRNISFITKKEYFDKFKEEFNVGDRATIRFYLTSRKKHDRWYTTVSILEMQKV